MYNAIFLLSVSFNIQNLFIQHYHVIHTTDGLKKLLIRDRNLQQKGRHVHASIFGTDLSCAINSYF